ncbi:hypothetical protein KFK14_12315 [Sphingobium phenoxybenzoativorans]|uniref:Uncharacterized protein n=1 Tax=Sphingobium phenoxybenzoativorans TaxID=1592790 RepID=A0A975K3X0_9SPHN|nr:hypothetical protein [Sphingobium phenoxybenzoativorans]QUT03934.1 hypothetical protein KFK14_12315 [Sphingobium phenoxybenzoativorans]
MSYQPSVAINARWVLAFLLLVWAIANGGPAIGVFAERAFDPLNWRLNEMESIFRNSRTWGGYWALGSVVATAIVAVPVACITLLRKPDGETSSLRMSAFLTLVIWFALFGALYFSMGFGGQMRPMSDPLCVGVETPGPDNCDVNGANLFMLALPTINVIVSATLLISTWFIYRRESKT